MRYRNAQLYQLHNESGMAAIACFFLWRESMVKMYCGLPIDSVKAEANENMFCNAHTIIHNLACEAKRV